MVTELVIHLGGGTEIGRVKGGGEEERITEENTCTKAGNEGWLAGVHASERAKSKSQPLNA